MAQVLNVCNAAELRMTLKGMEVRLWGITSPQQLMELEAEHGLLRSAGIFVTPDYFGPLQVNIPRESISTQRAPSALNEVNKNNGVNPTVQSKVAPGAVLTAAEKRKELIAASERGRQQAKQANSAVASNARSTPAVAAVSRVAPSASTPRAKASSNTSTYTSRAPTTPTTPSSIRKQKTAGGNTSSSASVCSVSSSVKSSQSTQSLKPPSTPTSRKTQTAIKPSFASANKARSGAVEPVISTPTASRLATHSGKNSVNAQQRVRDADADSVVSNLTTSTAASTSRRTAGPTSTNSRQLATTTPKTPVRQPLTKPSTAVAAISSGASGSGVGGSRPPSRAGTLPPPPPVGRTVSARPTAVVAGNTAVVVLPPRTPISAKTYVRAGVGLKPGAATTAATAMQPPKAVVKKAVNAAQADMEMDNKTKDVTAPVAIVGASGLRSETDDAGGADNGSVERISPKRPAENPFMMLLNK